MDDVPAPDSFSGLDGWPPASLAAAGESALDRHSSSLRRRRINSEAQAIWKLSSDLRIMHAKCYFRPLKSI
jgi:hypothetical protein